MRTKREHTNYFRSLLLKLDHAANHPWAGLTARAEPEDRLGLDRNLVNLICGVSRSLVDLLYCLSVWGLREAEDNATLRVRPRLLEVHTFLVLYVEVGLVSLHEGIRRDSLHASVNVHKLRHCFSFLVRHRLPTTRAGKGQETLVDGGNDGVLIIVGEPFQMAPTSFARRERLYRRSVVPAGFPRASASPSLGAARPTTPCPSNAS